MSNFDYQEKNEKAEREIIGDEIFSMPVKAGKRIYYFDVKATRNDDYYVTVTESRKRQLRDGSFVIDKHKIHVYKEDFSKFVDGLQSVLDYIRQHKPDSFVESAARVTGDAVELDQLLIQDIPTEEDFFKGL